MKPSTPAVMREYNRVKFAKLAGSLTLDAVGMASYIVPFLGEAADLVWAPISGLAVFLMYRSKKGAVAGAINGIKEAAPLTDFVPVVSAFWGYKYLLDEEKTLQEFMAIRNARNEILLGAPSDQQSSGDSS